MLARFEPESSPTASDLYLQSYTCRYNICTDVISHLLSIVYHLHIKVNDLFLQYMYIKQGDKGIENRLKFKKID